MILRHFEISDIRNLKTYRYPEKSDLEILSLINEWNRGGCSGRYFEMFTIAHGGQAVGEILAYEHTEDTVSIGVHVYKPFRNKGFAKFGITTALNVIAPKGYKYAISLVDEQNKAAQELFLALDFKLNGSFVDHKGYRVCTFKKEIN